MRTLRWLLPLALLLVSGCLRSSSTLTLKKDGSGTIDVDYSIAEQTIAQLKTMIKVQGGLAEAMDAEPPIPESEYTRVFLDPSEEALRAEMKRYERYGVSVELLQVARRNARRSVRMKLRFRNLAEVAMTDVFADCGFSVTRKPDGNYLLYREGTRTAPEDSIDFSDPRTVRLLSPLLSGFNVVVTVNTPGRILESNATSKGPYTAGWEYDFDRDAKALQALQSNSMIVLFDGEGISLPTVKQPK